MNEKKIVKDSIKNHNYDDLKSAFDSMLSSSGVGGDDFEEVSTEELNEYIDGLECQAEDLRHKLAKANESAKELQDTVYLLEKDLLRQSVFMINTAAKLERHQEWQATANVLRRPTREAKQALKKFALKQKIEVFNVWLYEVKFVEGLSARDVIESAQLYIEQLRKEQGE